MSMIPSLERWRGRLQRAGARYGGRRPFAMRNHEPLISFTFDDFPRSALHVAGRILEDRGIAGTYYVSLGLMGTMTPTGEMFTQDDLTELLDRGHELGCHTYAHCDAAETPAGKFEQSVIDNREAHRRLVPNAPEFRTLSYPIGSPRPGTKRRCGRHFAGCRAGGQTHNTGTIDLNLMQAFFLEQSRDNPDVIFRAIDATCSENGWLVFATHDVCVNPTRYGCTSGLFSEIVEYAVSSGARIAPVTSALRVVGAN
jgi:peptidoglycan/xylan/chitin deacetylase (PgdA/CDA1 family)